MVTTTMNSSALAPAANRGRGFEAIRTFVEMAGAALRCAAAVESGYRPNTRDLRTLGIEDQLARTSLLGR